MNRKKMLLTVSSAIALALTVWTVGATVNLSTIGFSATSGDVVSASEFNNAFATIDTNFSAVESAINEHDAEQPGAAQNLSDLTAVSLDGNLQTAMSLDVDVPATGFVVVTATGYVELDHTNGTDSRTVFGVSSDTTDLPPAQDIDAALPGSAASGFYVIPFSAQRVFEAATAGTTSFHLLAQRTAGSGGRLADVTLTAMYVPNAYGAITTTSAIESTGSNDR